MKTLTCMIVDDEPLAVKMLEDFVSRTPYLRLAASFNDPVLALSTLRESPVDVLFLDIQMPDLDGLNLSRMVPPSTRVIFTTAFKEYAFDSYEVNALDFLLKPIRYHKFLGAAEKARQWFEMSSVKEERGSLFVRVDSQLRQVEISRILYVTGLKDYVIREFFIIENPIGVQSFDFTLQSVEIQIFNGSIQIKTAGRTYLEIASCLSVI